MDPVMVLAYIAIMLMAGILCSFISKQLKLPYNLILIFLGLFLGTLFYNGSPLIEIDRGFVLSVGTLILIMLVFDSASRVRMADATNEAIPAMRLINNFTLISVIVVTFIVAYSVFPSPTLEAVLYALLFSVLVIETDIGAVLVIFKDFAKERGKRILKFLETEAELNTAFVAILPFVVLSLMRNVDYENQSLLSALLVNLPDFLYELLIGIGIGLVVGLILLRMLRGWYEENFAPVLLITACLVAYVFTGLLGGNGIVAVAVMGFFYGSSYVSGKEQLNEFSVMFHSALEMIVFILLGMYIQIPLTKTYIIMSLVIFGSILIVRMLSVFLSLQNEQYTNKEKVFIGLNMPKGIALASVLLVLSTFGATGLTIVVQLAFMVMAYSLALSFILDVYAEKMLSEPVKDHSHSINLLEMNMPDEMVHVNAKARKKSAKKKTAKKTSKKKASKSRKKKRK